MRQLSVPIPALSTLEHLLPRDAGKALDAHAERDFAAVFAIVEGSSTSTSLERVPR
jgi:hypothetical protein